MTPLASPVGDSGFPKSPGAFDLVVHFLEWKNIGLEQCIKMCTKYLPVYLCSKGRNQGKGSKIGGDGWPVCGLCSLRRVCGMPRLCTGGACLPSAHVCATRELIHNISKPLSRAQPGHLALYVKNIPLKPVAKLPPKCQ